MLITMVRATALNVLIPRGNPRNLRVPAYTMARQLRAIPLAKSMPVTGQAASASASGHIAGK